MAIEAGGIGQLSLFASQESSASVVHLGTKCELLAVQDESFLVLIELVLGIMTPVLHF